MLSSLPSSPSPSVYNGSDASSLSERDPDQITDAVDSQSRTSMHELETEETFSTGLEETRLLGQQEAPLTYPVAANRLIKLAGPLSLSRLGMAMHGIVNGIIVRNLSHSEMAAVPFAMASISEVISIVQGILQSTGVFVGELSGAQEHPRIGEVVTQSW